MNVCAAARKNAEKRWLENDDNINCYKELFLYSYGSPERVLLNKINNIKL